MTNDALSPLCSSSDVDAAMWRYQRPGLEAVLLAELQRQQQCSQFCDTLLKAGGITVPAHSCVLSAISSQLSSALSSTPDPPTGQSRLLEFGALGSCTLLHIVSLLYSGEMMGQGERERQEAVIAASKLGIRGLVEVTERAHESGNEKGGVPYTEVGVQTEPLMNEENDARPGRWRREVRDGRTLLLKESNCEQNTWTQTEWEREESTAPPPHQAASFQTINMTDIQSLGDPSNITYIPVSFICPPDGNLDSAHLPPSSVPVASTEESTVADHGSVFFLSPTCSSAPPSIPVNDVPQEAGATVVAAEEWEEAAIQSSIPEFINYFLSVDMEEDSHRGRAKRRRGRGTGGARRAGTGESRARRPRASTTGRGRGVTHTLNVQEVKGSKLQMKWLHRWGVRESRKGQGGGTVGRKPLKPQKSCQRRGGGGKLWEISQCEEVLLPRGDKQRGRRRNRPQPPEQDGAAVRRGQRARAQSVSISPSMQVYNQTRKKTQLSRPSSSTSVQSSPRPSLQSPPASVVASAAGLLHTTTLPPMAPPQQENQPGHLENLFEEVMMDLDIFPNNKHSASHPEPPHPASGSSCADLSPGGSQNKHGLHGSAEVIAGDSSLRKQEVLTLQQPQGEGELSEILDNFLQSFELFVDRCSASEGATQSDTEVNQLQPHSVHGENSDNCTQTTAPHLEHTHPPCPTQAPSLQSNTPRSVVRSEIPPQSQSVPPSSVCTVLPNMKKEREVSCQSLEVQSPTGAKLGPSSVKHPLGGLPVKKHPVTQIRKIYPLRSSVREKRSVQSLTIIEEQLSGKQPLTVSKPAGAVREVKGHLTQPTRINKTTMEGDDESKVKNKRGRPRKNERLLCLCNGESSRATTSPFQLQPGESCGRNEQLEEKQERQEVEVTALPQEHAEESVSVGKKRGMESEEDKSDDANVAKRVCCEQTAPPTCESAECVPEALTFVKGEETDGERLMDAEMERISSSDETLGDVGGDKDETKPPLLPPSHSAVVVSLGSAGSGEEEEQDDIDVVGGVSPTPEVLTFSWTSECSESDKEDGDEEIDVVGEVMDGASVALLLSVQ